MEHWVYNTVILGHSVSFNVDTIILSPDTVDVYNPKVVRSTQGILFHIDFVVRDLKPVIEKLHKKVTVKNFSAAAQIHRQHLHAILELLPKYNPDIVIFYGGFNDLWVGTWADPRPGYPYNFYYVREVPTATKFFVENSAICMLLQEKFNLFFSPQKFWKSVFVCTDEWQKIDADKYIETLGLAKKVTETFESKYYGKTRFVAFYQPFQDADYFEKAQKMVQEKIKGLDYVYDLHNAFDGMGDVYTDICHVKEDSGANEHIIDLMSDITAKKFPLK